MRYMKMLSSVLVICLSVSGCSFLAPKTSKVHVLTDKADSEIYINGAMVGRGKVSYEVPRDKSALVAVRGVRYARQEVAVDTKMSTAGKLDVVGGCLWIVPFLGLTSAGARTLERTEFSFKMRRQ